MELWKSYKTVVEIILECVLIATTQYFGTGLL